MKVLPPSTLFFLSTPAFHTLNHRPSHSYINKTPPSHTFCTHGPHSFPCKHPTPPWRHTRQPEAFRLTPSSSLPLSLRRPPYATLTTPASSSHIVSVFLHLIPAHPTWLPGPGKAGPELSQAREQSACVCLPVLP